MDSAITSPAAGTKRSKVKLVALKRIFMTAAYLLPPSPELLNWLLRYASRPEVPRSAKIIATVSIVSLSPRPV